MARSDGKRAKDVDLLYAVIPHLMVNRHDSMNMITIDVPEDPIKKYISKNRRENLAISHMAVLITAYLRICALFPKLNRFISNKKVYDRKGFYISMVVLRGSVDDNDSTTIKVKLDYNDTIFDVDRKLRERINQESKITSTNNTDKMARFLINTPGLLRIGVKLFRFMDRIGMLPKKIIELSPFHTSLFISNLASIRTNHIYHHIYDFGTTSVFITMGNMREVPFREKNEIVHKTCLPLGIVMDERICDGKYFAKAFAKFKTYLANPSLLETPLSAETV